MTTDVVCKPCDKKSVRSMLMNFAEQILSLNRIYQYAPITDEILYEISENIKSIKRYAEEVHVSIEEAFPITIDAGGSFEILFYYDGTIQKIKKEK